MPKTISSKQKTVNKKQKGETKVQKNITAVSRKQPSFALQSELRKGKKALHTRRQVKAKLSVEVLSLSGKKTRVQLSEKIFKVDVKPQTLAQAVRVYLANQRKGTAATLTRGEVRGGGRKPWRQKGTGRARQGSIRAPQWRGGGVVFGPTISEFELKLPKKVRRKALLGALSQKLEKEDLRIVDDFEKIKPKTGEFVKACQKLKLPSNKVLWVVDGDAGNLLRAGRNLPGLTFCKVANLTTYEILKAQNLIFTKAAIEKLAERVT